MNETLEPLILPAGIILLFAVCALFLLVVLLAILKLFIGFTKPKAGFPYEPQSALFTAAERSFLGVLEQALDDRHRVFGKVRVADVLKVRSGLSSKSWQAAFNRISSKHVDFVVCRKDDLSIAFLVELDDKSHGKRKRIARDKLLDSAIEAAGLRLVRVPAQKRYSVEAVREAIRG